MFLLDSGFQLLENHLGCQPEINGNHLLFWLATILNMNSLKKFGLWIIQCNVIKKDCKKQ